MDEWGVGSYEATAAELAPVSDVAVAALGLRAGERVLDVACGTGNASLAADAAGARATGLDTSRRLLEVARERCPGAEFVLADATELPFADGQFDSAVSIFGVIFAQPPEQAAAELARVVRPGGQIAITTWPPRGPIFAGASLMREAVARVHPPEGPSPADWGDRSVLERLLSPYGVVEIAEHQLTYENTTPEDVWERWERLHPMWIRARGLLQPTGAWERLREDSIAALREAGMGAGATAPYLLTVVKRD